MLLIMNFMDVMDLTDFMDVIDLMDFMDLIDFHGCLLNYLNLLL